MSIYVNNQYYHVYNRGVAKQPIFVTEKDYVRLLNTFSFYIENASKPQYSKIDSVELSQVLATVPEKPLVEIIAYCLMPNHFHLILKQLVENGIGIFLRRSLDSYTRYYNTKNNRVGPIFQGRTKSVLVENDEYLLHLSRYLHLNPYVSSLCKELLDYRWSSYHQYLNNISNRICHTGFILELIGSPESYQKFVEDFASYAVDLERLKHLTIE